jgi:hypothetical protein
VFSCAACATAVWSRYHRAPGDSLFVRAGTLDTPDAVTPDVHIFTRSKLPWLDLPAGVPAFKSIYRIQNVWSAESRERLRRNLARTTRVTGGATPGRRRRRGTPDVVAPAAKARRAAITV